MIVGNLNLVLKDGEKVSCVYEDNAHFNYREFDYLLKSLYYVPTKEMQQELLSKFKVGKSEKAIFTYNFDTNMNKVLRLDCKYNPITKRYARGKLLETYYIN